MRKADIIIIGSGPGGYNAAADAADQGKDVILIEKDLLGGTCLNRGCIPTKCLCASAGRMLDIEKASELGIKACRPEVDFAAVRARMVEVMSTLREGVAALLEGVTVICGEATIEPDKRVRVDGEEYTADKILIATGSRPAPLHIPGGEYAMDSTAFLALEEMPASAVIVGGGVIGLEFASVLNAFGAEVTVLEFCKEILPGFDKEIAKRLRTYLTRRGIKIVTGARVTALPGQHTVNYEVKGNEKSLSADAIIAAVGRRPVVPEGCVGAGIAMTERGYIKVDPETFETSVEGIHAIGDVNGICLLAHAAEAQARRVLGFESNIAVIPSVVFTEPECASVGLTEEKAEEAGIEVSVAKVPYGSNGKALASGHTDGLLKLVVDKSSGKILGCHAVGAHAGDLIAEATVAISAGMTAAGLSATVHAHPTLSEILARASMHTLA